MIVLCHKVAKIFIEQKIFNRHNEKFKKYIFIKGK